MQTQISIPASVIQPQIDALGEHLGTGYVGFVGVFIPGVNDSDHHQNCTVMHNGANKARQVQKGGNFVHSSTTPKNLRFKPYIVICPPGYMYYNYDTHTGIPAHSEGWAGAKYIDCPKDGIAGFTPDQDGFWVRPK